MTMHVEFGVTDMTKLGFEPSDLSAMYFAREPYVGEIMAAAAELDAESRKLALALIRTMAVHDEMRQLRA